MEEQKLAPSPHSETFRIDPSYQYAYPCGACAGPAWSPISISINARKYSVGYGQLEQQMLQQPYPVSNVLLQHNVQHYPYPDAMQWGGAMMPGAPKLLMHDLCPVYPQYPYMYPQVLDRPSSSDDDGPRAPMSCDDTPTVPNSPTNLPAARQGQETAPQPQSSSQRTTPQPRDRDADIAAKIQQIKDQMSQMNTQDKEKSGNGLLGNAPVNYNGRLGSVSTNDETQLSSAARAIVNSIRNMQAHAHTSQHDARRHVGDYRDRRDEDKRRPHRQMSPGNWCRRSPGPVHPALNHPWRPHPDTRNGRR
ncbi:uncharacterized protein LOC125238995 [Leguminivora glycinivorella]|uniref:uncharacterized protein LOC125238995 n=1 Tax=Leguminivora glycinivorella TaxID=1035111 RepID=UPI00200E28CD|nr:uncharacterized protein LOC125238995 [Leguminivora glycinivorella]